MLSKNIEVYRKVSQCYRKISKNIEKYRKVIEKYRKISKNIENYQHPVWEGASFKNDVTRAGGGGSQESPKNGDIYCLE